MYLAFKDQNLPEIVSKLSSIEYKWLIISILFGALAFVSRGLRWIYLINALGYQASRKNSINSVAVGYLTNILIPRAGEISRCTSLQQVEKIPFDKLFGTIILERVIDLAILIILILAAFLYKFKEINEFFNEVFGESSGNIFTNPILLFLIASLLIIFVLRKHIKKLSFYEKIINILIGLKDGFSSLKKIKNKTPFILHTIFIWAMYVLMTYVCFFSINETKDLNLFDGIYITVIGGLGMVVPSQGGIGSYHLAVKLGLVGIGIGVQSALLFAFAVHTAQTLMAIVFGIISSLLLLSHKKNIDD
tara:strand:- start:1223 stop:2137 length:915 start_codon:yes stop_codon:yes gene_type:complete